MNTPPPAGWYPSPYNSGDEQWWDGTQWTPHSRPVAQPQTPVPTAVPDPQQSSRPTEQPQGLGQQYPHQQYQQYFAPQRPLQKSRVKLWLLISSGVAVIAAIAVTLIFVFSSSREEQLTIAWVKHNTISHFGADATSLPVSDGDIFAVTNEYCQIIRNSSDYVQLESESNALLNKFNDSEAYTSGESTTYKAAIYIAYFTYCPDALEKIIELYPGEDRETFRNTLHETAEHFSVFPEE